MDRPAHFDLGYWAGATSERLKSLEKGQARLDGELLALRREVESAFTWARRLALLTVLWLGAIGVNVDPQRTADLALWVLGLALKGG